ncbi:MAG: 1-deoxy-D-xylulose-5-phosphate synthase, partial [Butyrivibrio sp.]|nr:1-deoxy-D-xylulose-5-phosphate synthase [Butyrivibrio sp.]
DGETHQGIFDLSYLSSMPNMHILAPKNKWELSDMLKYAVNLGAPVAIRYPRGNAYDGLKEFRAPIEMGKCEPIYEEKDICLLAVGGMVKTAEKVRDILKGRGLKCSLVNARFVKPIDTDYIHRAVGTHRLFVTMEENVASGGYGEKVIDYISEKKLDAQVLSIHIPDMFVTHGSVDKLSKELGIDADSIAERVLKEVR